MPANPITPSQLMADFGPEVTRAAESALQSYTIPSNVFIEDIKEFAKLLKNAGVTEHKVRLNVAALILAGMPWLKASNILGARPPLFSVVLRHLGGQDRPHQIAVASTSEMITHTVEHLLRRLSSTGGAVIDTERGPQCLTLTVTDRARPTFVIECRASFSPKDHVRFTYSLIEQLRERAPAVLVNNGLLAPDSKAIANTEVFFQVDAIEGSYRSGRLVSELELFELLHRWDIGRGEAGSPEFCSARAGTLGVQVGFRQFDAPWVRSYRRASGLQLDLLYARYMTWRSAVEDLSTCISELKERRRKKPLALNRAGNGADDAACVVHADASLLIDMALGVDFRVDAEQRNIAAITSRTVREVALGLVDDHVAALQDRIEGRYPGALARFDEHLHAQVQPTPRQLMSMLNDIGEVALGYWSHCKDVVGAAGRFTALEYGTRVTDPGLAQSLKRDAIKANMACPCCGAPAALTVAMLPTEAALGAWKLDCASCGHTEEVRDTPTDAFWSSLPALQCSCSTCTKRGKELLDRHGNVASKFRERLDEALDSVAENLLEKVPGWELAADGVARLGPSTLR